MKFKFNPIIFKTQKIGGITTLWRSLLYLDENKKLGNNITQKFLGEKIEISNPSRIIFAKKMSFI